MENEEFKNFINQDYKSIASWLFSLSPYEFTLLSTATGYLLTPNLSINELNSLGNFLILIGQIMLTVNAQAITKLQNPKKFSDFKPYMQKDNIIDEVTYLKEEVYKIIKENYGNDKA